MKYLIIRMSSMGDVILATPVARALKRSSPESIVHFLTETEYVPLLEASRDIDRVLPYDKRGDDSGAEGILRISGCLRCENYDVLIDLQHKARSVFLSRLSGARRIISMKKRTLGGSVREAAGISSPMEEMHSVEMYLNVIKKIGIEGQGLVPELPVDDEARAKIDQAYNPARQAGRKIAGFNVGAGRATKRLPFKAIMDSSRLLHDQGFDIVLLGAKADTGIVEKITSELSFPALMKTTSLGLKELAAAIEGMDVLVSGDSGPVHLAGAVGTPVVAVFGPTSPRRWGPLGERNEVIRHKLPCAPCTNFGSAKCPENIDIECMKQVSGAEIFEAVRRVINS